MKKSAPKSAKIVQKEAGKQILIEIDWDWLRLILGLNSWVFIGSDRFFMWVWRCRGWLAMIFILSVTWLQSRRWFSLVTQIDKINQNGPKPRFRNDHWSRQRNNNFSQVQVACYCCVMNHRVTDGSPVKANKIPNWEWHSSHQTGDRPLRSALTIRFIGWSCLMLLSMSTSSVQRHWPIKVRFRIYLRSQIFYSWNRQMIFWFSSLFFIWISKSITSLSIQRKLKCGKWDSMK